MFTDMGWTTNAPGGSPSPSPAPGQTFADVPPSAFGYREIEQFVARGITTGCFTDATGARFYCPDRNVTRAEMAVFLIRAFPAP